MWKWMEKELRTTKNQRVGTGSSWGHSLPETPRMHGFLCLPIPPTWSDEGASGPYLCVRQGLRALRLTHQVSFCGAVPFFRKGLFSVQRSLLVFFFFFGIELVCGLLPAQQSFLGFSNSPGMCPVKPHGLSCRGIPPAVLPQVWQGARCVKPLPRLASPLPGTALLLSALGRDNPCHRALSMGLVSSFSYIYC